MDILPQNIDMYGSNDGDKYRRNMNTVFFCVCIMYIHIYIFRPERRVEFGYGDYRWHWRLNILVCVDYHFLFTICLLKYFVCYAHKNIEYECKNYITMLEYIFDEIVLDTLKNCHYLYYTFLLLCYSFSFYSFRRTNKLFIMNTERKHANCWQQLF